MPQSTDALVTALRRDPAATALLCDFDGTLSPIVEGPEAARPLAGVPELLQELSRAYGLVAVISGRPVSFLLTHVGDGPKLVGLYGLERVDGGEVVAAPGVGQWRPVVDAAAERAAAELPAAVGVEHKGLSLTLHTRPAPEHRAAVDAWADAASQRWGLEQRTARMSVELHPPVEIDKGTVVAALLQEVPGVATACFVGDDVGDLPAFDAVRRFSDGARRGHRVVVGSSEASPELLAMADVLLSDPNDVRDLLRALVP